MKDRPSVGISTLADLKPVFRGSGLKQEIVDRQFDSWERLFHYVDNRPQIIKQWVGIDFAEILKFYQSHGRIRVDEFHPIARACHRKVIRLKDDRSGAKKAIEKGRTQAMNEASICMQLELIQTWYDHAYRRTQAYQHNCRSTDFVHVDVGRQAGLSGVSFEDGLKNPKNMLSLPGNFLSALGSISSAKFDALANDDKHFCDWRLTNDDGDQIERGLYELCEQLHFENQKALRR